MALQPMKGVNVVEVAQFTFTPSAGAVLADWGADVIKVEHAVTGDAQRGMHDRAGGAAAGSFQPLMEHPNRGKRSIGLALDGPGGSRRPPGARARRRRLPHQLLPSARQRLHLDVEDMRASTRTSSTSAGAATAFEGPRQTSRVTTARPSGRAWERMGATPPDSPRLIIAARRRLRRLDGRGDHGGWHRRGPVRP